MRILPPALLLVLALPATAPAEVSPSRGIYDPRVKTVGYNADDVVRIIGHYGFSTNIEFAKDESVQSIALGDSLAWEVAPRGNQLFVKPREDNATTNMTVITDRRSYQFWLDAAKAPNKGRGEDMYFRVKFHYPQDAARLSGETDAKRRAEAALRILPPPRNWNYWACGDPTLRPSEAYDDGRFTYLRFPGAQEIPAAFVVNSDGAESLANGSMRGDQLVLQAVTRRIVLRKGKAAACLENRSFDPRGVGTPSGTTSPVVERRIKDDARPPPPELPTQAPVTEEPDRRSNATPALPVGPVQPSLPQSVRPVIQPPRTPGRPLLRPSAQPPATTPPEETSR